MINYFIKHLNCSHEYSYENSKIYIGIKKEKINIFKKKKYWISIIISNENDIINNIKNICDYILKIFLENINNKLFIDANIFIFNDIVDVNMYKKLDIKDNIRYNNMYNRFVLMNNYTGELYFNPEKIENKVISERIKFLYKYFKTENPMDEEKENQFNIEIKNFIDVLEIVLKDSK